MSQGHSRSHGSNFWPYIYSALDYNPQVNATQNTFQCSLDPFGLDIFRLCPSFFYSTRPFYKCLEFLELLQGYLDVWSDKRLSDQPCASYCPARTLSRYSALDVNY